MGGRYFRFVLHTFQQQFQHLSLSRLCVSRVFNFPQFRRNKGREDFEIVRWLARLLHLVPTKTQWSSFLGWIVGHQWFGGGDWFSLLQRTSRRCRLVVRRRWSVSIRRNGRNGIARFIIHCYECLKVQWELSSILPINIEMTFDSLTKFTLESATFCSCSTELMNAISGKNFQFGGLNESEAGWILLRFTNLRNCVRRVCHFTLNCSTDILWSNATAISCHAACRSARLLFSSQAASQMQLRASTSPINLMMSVSIQGMVTLADGLRLRFIVLAAVRVDRVDLVVARTSSSENSSEHNSSLSIFISLNRFWIISTQSSTKNNGICRKQNARGTHRTNNVQMKNNWRELSK